VLHKRFKFAWKISKVALSIYLNSTYEIFQLNIRLISYRLIPFPIVKRKWQLKISRKTKIYFSLFSLKNKSFDCSEMLNCHLFGHYSSLFFTHAKILLNKHSPSKSNESFPKHHHFMLNQIVAHFHLSQLSNFVWYSHHPRYDRSSIKEKKLNYSIVDRQFSYSFSFDCSQCTNISDACAECSSSWS